MPKEPKEEDVLIPGVLVSAQRTPDGFAVSYNVVGGLDPLAVPALLELGIKVVRENLGLN